MDPSGLINVFVVEDSPAIRDVLFQRIEDDPRFVVTGFAATALAAIGQLEKVVPDVLIMDLHLTQGTGYDVLMHLRRANKLGNINIIVLTNFASAAHQRQAMALGANSFFDKSMQFDEMLDALHLWADEHYQQRPTIDVPD